MDGEGELEALKARLGEVERALYGPLWELDVDAARAELGAIRKAMPAIESPDASGA
jgi:hypothetical protein